MRMRLLSIFFMSVVVAVVVVSQAFGQAAISNAQLNGTVEDPGGRAVVNASISLRNLDTNNIYTTATNGSGYYLLASLPPGKYEMKVAAPSFAPYTRQGMALTVGQFATVDIKLTVGERQEVVDVTTEPPTIEPSRTEVSQVIGTQEIRALPTSQRQFTDFALLTPGVATSRTRLGPTFTRPEATQPYFAGSRSSSIELTL